MTTRSSVGWLILLAALAVPGFMFYGWWSRVNKAADTQMAQKVRRRLPEGGGLFADAPVAGKLKNPMAAETPAAAAAPKAPAAPAPAAAGKAAVLKAPAAAPAAPPPVAREPAAAPSPAAAPMDAPAAAPAQAQEPQAAEIPPPPLVLRDPTMSPYDVVRLEQLALERTLKQQEVREAVTKKPVKREPPIEGTIDLQGIITNTQSGNKAIVNGEMVGEGDTIGKVKVLKISAQSVTFIHRNKKFVKTFMK